MNYSPVCKQEVDSAMIGKIYSLERWNSGAATAIGRGFGEDQNIIEDGVGRFLYVTTTEREFVEQYLIGCDTETPPVYLPRIIVLDYLGGHVGNSASKARV